MSSPYVVILWKWGTEAGNTAVADSFVHIAIIYDAFYVSVMQSYQLSFCELKSFRHNVTLRRSNNVELYSVSQKNIPDIF